MPAVRIDLVELERPEFGAETFELETDKSKFDKSIIYDTSYVMSTVATCFEPFECAGRLVALRCPCSGLNERAACRGRPSSRRGGHAASPPRERALADWNAKRL